MGTNPDGGASQLSLVTYNIWFEAVAREERCRGLSDLLAGLRPDIIGLQEATLRMLRPLLEQDWVRRDYWCSASPASPAHTHGVVLLARHGPARLGCDPLPGEMGRRLLWADFGDLRVGAVHLESMSVNAPTRREQLERIFPRLAEASSAVLMGDFNLCASWPENAHLDPGYLDLWAHLHSGEMGYTQDSDVNAMLRKAKAVRFDRILLRSERWRPLSSERLGTEPITPGIFISDHFGLLSSADRRRGPGQAPENPACSAWRSPSRHSEPACRRAGRRRLAGARSRAEPLLSKPGP